MILPGRKWVGQSYLSSWRISWLTIVSQHDLLYNNVIILLVDKDVGMYGVIIFVLLFSAMLSCFYLGHALMLRQHQYYPNEKHTRNKIIEGVIFALLGLLIAFTFSGAHERFELRRATMIDEVNTIESAYKMLGVLPSKERAALRAMFMDYVSERIAVYQCLPHIKSAAPHLKASESLANAMWLGAMKSCQAQASPASCIVLLPVMIKMMELANTRTIMTQIHPPVIIMIILVGLSLCSFIFLGYSIDKVKIWHSLHVLAYAIIMSFIIFTIIDLEYPRLGILHADYFDYILMDLQQRLLAT